MFEHIRQFIANRTLYRMTVAELDSLTDRELSDLSISRCDIDRIARDAVWGDQPSARTAAKPAANRRAFA